MRTDTAPAIDGQKKKTEKRRFSSVSCTGNSYKVRATCRRDEAKIDEAKWTSSPWEKFIILSTKRSHCHDCIGCHKVRTFRRIHMAFRARRLGNKAVVLLASLVIGQTHLAAPVTFPAVPASSGRHRRDMLNRFQGLEFKEQKRSEGCRI